MHAHVDRKFCIDMIQLLHGMRSPATRMSILSILLYSCNDWEGDQPFYKNSSSFFEFKRLP